MTSSEPSVSASASDGSLLPTSPGLTVAAVARRLGVAPATLRTWDRRYGLGPTAHAAGSHRRYTAEDVARLDLMRRLVNAGAPPVDAARTARATPVTAAPESHLLGVVGWPQADPAAEDDEVHGGSTSVVPLPTGAAAVRGLLRAAASLDPIACGVLVRDTLESRGVVWTWDHLLVPVLLELGEEWAQTGRGVEVEHMLSESVVGALTGVASRLRRPVNPRPVLLASAAEEMHCLPLFAVAAGLAERQVAARVLGARVPREALVSAIRRTGPGAVLVWSSLPSPDGQAQLASLPVLRPAPVVLAAGPGWGPELPDGVSRVDDLVGAIARISRIAGA